MLSTLRTPAGFVAASFCSKCMSNPTPLFWVVNNGYALCMGMSQKLHDYTEQCAAVSSHVCAD